MNSIPNTESLRSEKASTSAEIVPTVEEIGSNRTPLSPIDPIDGQASLVVAPDSKQILAADFQVSDWLGSTPTISNKNFLADLIPNLDSVYLDKHLATHLKAPCLLQATIKKRDGSNFHAAVHITPLLGPNETRLLVTIRPLESLAEYALRCDALTGLPDRRELSAHRSRWQLCASARQVPHALLFMDLDNFKQINDQHGHATGDRLLATLATRWRRCIRDDDLLVRYGGDEFVILLAGVRRRREIDPVVSRLMAATTEPVAIDNQPLRVGATIGIALAEDVSVDLDQLIASADRDMYRQKRRSGTGSSKR